MFIFLYMLVLLKLRVEKNRYLRNCYYIDISVLFFFEGYIKVFFDLMYRGCKMKVYKCI